MNDEGKPRSTITPSACRKTVRVRKDTYEEGRDSEIDLLFQNVEQSQQHGPKKDRPLPALKLLSLLRRDLLL